MRLYQGKEEEEQVEEQQQQQQQQQEKRKSNNTGNNNEVNNKIKLYSDVASYVPKLTALYSIPQYFRR